MIDNSVQYVLSRIEDDSSLTPVSSHESVGEGVSAGMDMVENVDLDYAYALRCGPTRVVSFREGRTGYRAWATRTGRISPSVEDRYDHDVDELLI